MVAAKIIDTCKRNKSKAVILKLDFHKAFDSVSWSSPEWALNQMKVPEKMDWLD